MFVNPAQFDLNEDLARYPRTEEQDARLAEREGVDFLFAPEPGELYPEGFATWVDVEETGAEGKARLESFAAQNHCAIDIMPEGRVYFTRTV